MNPQDKKEEDKRTPIIDGDARPDLPLHNDKKKDPKITSIKEKERTTQSRADTDSQDDFRDAKL